MLVLSMNQSLENAIEKSRKEMPTARMIEYGVYEVTTSHSVYQVKCWRDDSGRKIVECQCQQLLKAKLEAKGKEYQEKYCYHLIGAITLHSIMTATRKAREVAQAEMTDDLQAEYLRELERPCKTCNSYITTNAEGYCEVCAVEKDSVDIFG